MSLLDSETGPHALLRWGPFPFLPLEERSNILDTIAERINNANDKVRHHALWAFSKIPEKGSRLPRCASCSSTRSQACGAPPSKH